MKKLLGSLLIVLLLFSTLGCSKAGNNNKVSLKLGLLSIEDNLPFFVAEKEGLFAKHGVEVQLVPFNSARDRDIALEAGEIQGELADLLAVALFKKGGIPVKVVSLGLGATPQEGRFAILSSPGSGITTPQQLKGIPIAISQNTIIHYLAEEMLKEVGIAPSELNFQSIPDLKIRLDALLAGKDVKAALLPDPLATLAEKSGAVVVVDDAKLKNNLSQTVILFREDTLKKYPESVKRILQAYEEAAGKLNESPEKYKELIIEKARIPKPLEKSYTIPKYSPLVLPTKAMVERVMNWMQNKGLIDKAYSYEDIVAPGYLQK
jgi:NitT/TauT family transport system substrate-binding protein